MDAAAILLDHVRVYRPDIYDTILKLISPHQIQSLQRLFQDHLEQAVPDLNIFNRHVDDIPTFCLLFTFLSRRKFPQPGTPFGIHLTCRLTKADTQGFLDSKHLQSTLQEEETQFNVDASIHSAINHFGSQTQVFELITRHEFATVFFENYTLKELLARLPNACILERGFPRNKGKDQEGRFGYLSTFQFIILSDRNVVKVLYRSVKDLQDILRRTEANRTIAFSDIRYVLEKCGTPLALNRNGLAKNPNRTHIEINAFEAFKKNLATFSSLKEPKVFPVGERASLDNIFVEFKVWKERDTNLPCCLQRIKMSCEICNEEFGPHEIYPNKYPLLCCHKAFHLACLRQRLLNQNTNCPSCKNEIRKMDRWTILQHSNDDDKCEICQSKDVYILTFGSCAHRFHKNCIAQWVGANNSTTCPTCRSPLKDVQSLTEWHEMVECRSIYAFFTSLEYGQLNIPFLDHIRTIIFDSYQCKIESAMEHQLAPEVWNLEKILYFFWEHFRNQLNPQQNEQFKILYRQHHKCSGYCSPGNCLVKGWNISMEFPFEFIPLDDSDDSDDPDVGLPDLRVLFQDDPYMLAIINSTITSAQENVQSPVLSRSTNPSTSNLSEPEIIEVFNSYRNGQGNVNSPVISRSANPPAPSQPRPSTLPRPPSQPRPVTSTLPRPLSQTSTFPRTSSQPRPVTSIPRPLSQTSTFPRTSSQSRDTIIPFPRSSTEQGTSTFPRTIRQSRDTIIPFPRSSSEQRTSTFPRTTSQSRDTIIPFSVPTSQPSTLPRPFTGGSSSIIVSPSSSAAAAASQIFSSRLFQRNETNETTRNGRRSNEDTTESAPKRIRRH
ncbi:hypothetical protein AVEN_122859-1 [Araneus ventricosus]|uniref:RING-type domain-containing protein n=1 Tax=Araneus ventricosus TaxID=182803 RepID=A0A4Y2QQK9_ARAVE|nr:hypothetical protein AVEN_122859-1 [Araneus ventricosus]